MTVIDNISEKGRLTAEVADVETWDAFVSDGAADVHQSSAWARVKAPGHVAHRAVLRNERGVPIAGAQMLVRTFGRAIRVGYVPLGPVASTMHEAKAVLDQLEATGKDIGLTALLVQPGRYGPLLGEALQARGYRPSRTDVATSATMELPLEPSLDDLRLAYSKSRRKNLKSARRYGVVVNISPPDCVEVFHELHVASAARNGFSPMSRDYLDRQCAELGVGDHIEIAIAELEGEAVAAGLFTVFNGRVDFKLTGWKPTRESSQACPNDAIQDVMIEWSKETGQQVFDLGGMPRRHAAALLSADVDRSDLADSGTLFKTSWGGNVKLYEPTYERIMRPLGQLAYRVPAALLADRGFGGRVVNWLRRS